MKYDVVLTRTAEGDLDDIVEYITRWLRDELLGSLPNSRTSVIEINDRAGALRA